jgi:hypothetical protein
MGSSRAVSLPKTSAGILLFRRNRGSVEVLLGHPGGPFWKKKDHGAWSIPKGLISFGEAPLDAAKREFECQSAFDWDPLAASKRDPFDRRALLVALGSSELVGVAETARARVV